MGIVQLTEILNGIDIENKNKKHENMSKEVEDKMFLSTALARNIISPRVNSVLATPGLVLIVHFNSSSFANLCRLVAWQCKYAFTGPTFCNLKATK